MKIGRSGPTSCVVVIPKDICRAADLHVGDEVVFSYINGVISFCKTKK